MSYKMTEKEMIDNLLSTNTRLRRQTDAKQLIMKCLNKKLEIAMEGLEAIEQYGNTNDIASKTIEQIKEVDIKIQN